LVLAAGCGPRPVKPPPPPPQPTSVPGYEARRDSLDSVDPAVLAGKRIVVDPGHGGFFAGALGVEGLTEAAVNLGVALRLRGLLLPHGAEVLLTRSEDRDFLSPADSSLRVDLAARATMARAFGPDLFISIHHNADPGGRHDVNETQTYYKLGDNGPSLELAQDVHRALVRNVGIRPNQVITGNYFVLRESEAPAILTETSYITNPGVERRLRLPEKQQLEAEALFLGLTRYFMRRLPRIESLVDQGAGVLSATVAGEFDRIDLEVDGRPVTPLRRGNVIEWQPPAPLDQGRHRASLVVGLAGEGTARPRTLEFEVRRETSRLEARAWPAGGVPRSVVAVEIRARDQAGRPTLDSLAIRIKAIRAAPSETVVVARDGIAWAYLRLAPVTTRAPGQPLKAAAVTATLAGTAAPAIAARVELRRLDVAPRRRAEFVRGPDGAPLTNAPGTTGAEPATRWINRDGFAVLDIDTSGAPVFPDLAGYRRLGDSDSLPAFVAIAGGVFAGRRIVLDPDGGGKESGGTGPGGTRASLVNLEVSRALAGLLEAAGAQVLLTRDGDYAVSEFERVRVSEAFHADRFLRIGHRAEAPRLGHYFSSAVGKRWAERTAGVLSQLGLGAPAVAEDAQYPIQQTSCPSLYVSAARVDSAADEERLAAPGALRLEAWALFLGLAGEWGSEPFPLDSVRVLDGDGRPVAAAAVRLGRGLVAQTDASGIARFARTEPGAMLVEISGGTNARSVLLDSDRGVTVSGLRAP
jgi:N-acetylmuramoyl-L-alanine amidase